LPHDRRIEGPKTYGYFGYGSATLVVTKISSISSYFSNIAEEKRKKKTFGRRNFVKIFI
jgi:hypothetical protein